MSANLQDRLFRKVALERLSSPDQLDQLVTIADPRSWLALAAFALILVFVLGWGIFGRIPTSVPAKGILVAEGGRVVAAMSPASGIVEKVSVKLGERVRKGQPVATIRQVETEQRLAHATTMAAELDKDLARSRAQLQKELAFKRDTLRQRATALKQVLASAQARIAYLEKQVANRQEMLQMGFATAERIQETRNELSQAKREAAEAQAQLISLSAEEATAQAAMDSELARKENSATEARHRAEELKTTLGESAQVLAPDDGRVTEIKVADGAVVSTGQPLVGIETRGGSLQAVVYIPTEHGKKVKTAMVARVAPSTVKKEESGMLLGKVTQVAAFPATQQGMAAVVQNESLVAGYAKSGAPYEARIDLTPADTPSGYAWTSGRGAEVELTTGTTVDAAITVREQRPIELVLPFLRKVFSGD
ncbi:hypothetical protein DLREEDagrD3_11450 [Denitratisoma sp. agr-D3]